MSHLWFSKWMVCGEIVSVRITNIGTLSVCKEQNMVKRLQGLFRQIGDSFSYIQFAKIITSTGNKMAEVFANVDETVPLKRLA